MINIGPEVHCSVELAMNLDEVFKITENAPPTRVVNRDSQTRLSLMAFVLMTQFHIVQLFLAKCLVRIES